MGYYSDVAIRIEVGNNYDVNEVIKEFQEGYNDKYHTFDLSSNLSYSYESNSFIITGYGLKWYEMNEEVRAFYIWCNYQADYNEKIDGIHFVRLGEELTDVEECIYGDPLDFIHIRREFEWE